MYAYVHMYKSVYRETENIVPIGLYLYSLKSITPIFFRSGIYNKVWYYQVQ